MAKKKTAPPKLSDLQKLWQLFHSLHFNEQEEFICGLPAGQVLKHPFVRRLTDHDEKALADEKNKRRKKGKPSVLEVISRKARMPGMTDGKLVHDKELIAANDGEKMERNAIKKARQRLGIKKK